MFLMPMIPPGKLPPLTMSFVGGNYANYPAWLQAGDLAVMYTGAGTNPGDFGGWKLLRYQTTDLVPIVVAARKLVGTETGVLPLPPGGAGSGAIIVFRPSRPFIDFSYPAFGGQYTTAAPAIQTITSSGGVAPLINIAFTIRSTGGLTLTCNPVMQGNYFPAEGPTGRFDYKIQNTAPVNQTVQMNDTGSTNTLVTGYIAVNG